ncbi:mCpol domain-containing protein [Mesorhizobium sp. C386A]|uniref:mCpol domain-containing protein n=1 Tax=unclassified Mesorhizobium TaxID=325217 RepID=UPI0003CE9DFA|nr:mCpol domain-containing protein [Mesorhizobium sp. LNJC386A00]ESY29536.1 hypothetical protein X748_27615 [Mesorhizobium sp. LNJC386A00]
MTYITIDGDDIGRQITAMYLRNDPISLSAFATMVQGKAEAIASMLRAQGFTVIFCAADGVVGQTENPLSSGSDMYQLIQSIGGSDLTFSAGVGSSLREAYIALLAAKSNGKARLVTFRELP